MSIDGLDTENDLLHNVHIKLGDDMLRDWRAIKLMVDYCKEDIRLSERHIVDQKRLVKELENYSAQVCSVKVAATSDGKGETLETQSSLDIGVL